MGNTLGCSIFFARPRVQTNKKCLVNNKLENRKKNLLKKRPKVQKTVDRSYATTENVTRQQDSEEKEDIKYQAFLQNCFQGIDDERNAQGNNDSEINSDILHDGYMKVSDFKRFVEENFHALDKQKSRKQLQAYFSDSVECKLPDTVQGFFIDDESTVITMEKEELKNDGNRGQPNIRNVSLNKTTGNDKSTNGEDDNQEPTKENKKKSAFERDNSYSRQERKLSHSTQHGKEDRRHEKNNAESVCFSNGNEEHLKENIANTPGLMAIPDSSGSNSESKSEYCEHVNIKQSESMYSDDSTSRQEFNHEHWYMSVASYANSAKNFTISRLHMKDEKVNATFMSLPNLSEIRYNPEYQKQHMKESVFPEATEVYSYSLSELSSSERETNADRMEELKRNSSTISSETNDSSADSGRSSNVTDFSTTKRVRSGYTRYLCKPDCSLCYAAQIEYMVEVYEPLLVRQIKVTDILEFLPFIDERNKEMLRSKHLQSSHEAMEMLIKIIMKSDATGKWQSFLDAIHETEFTYIRMLLTDDTEIQYNYSTAVLLLIGPEIRNRMCLPDFLDKVFEKELLTEAEKDEAISLSTGTAVKAYIIDRIDKHLPNWDNVFIEVLRDSCMSDLADLFRLVSQNESCDSELSPTTKGRTYRNKLKRTIRKHRLQVMERAHHRPVGDFSESQATVNSGLNGLPKLSTRYSASTVDQIVVTDFAEPKMTQVTLLQTLVSEQVELKRLLKDIKDEITELKVRM